jgi:glycosyltransferase 2 family protein
VVQAYSPMNKNGIGKWIKLILAALLAVALFYLAMRGVRFADAWRVMRNIRWFYLAAGLLLVLVSPLVRAWRWRKLYEGEVPEFWMLVRAIVVGQTLNFAVPFRTGDVARVFMVGGRKLDAAGTLVFEKLMDAGLFAALCLLLPFVWVVPGWLEGPRLSVIVMAAAFLAAIVILAMILPRFFTFPKIVRMPPVKRIPILAVTTLFLGISGVALNDFVIRSLHIDATLIASVVLLVILQVGVAVPSTPGKVGIFQYLAVRGLSLFGVDSAQALAFGLILHILIFLPPALMAAVFFLIGRRNSVAAKNAL